jgi:hypothetical protein
MTADPACCAPDAPLGRCGAADGAAQLRRSPGGGCGRPLIGVVTDRDIVCRVLAAGKTRWSTRSILHVAARDHRAPRHDAYRCDDHHGVPPDQARAGRDDHERCVGIEAQADLAWAGPQKDVAVLVREVSRDTDLSSR